MRVLVTRPGADGHLLANILDDLGIDTIREPLLTIRNLDVKTIDLDGIQAYLTTSANGVKALINVKPNFDIPLFAVGDASAITARQEGFKTVHSASGNVAALAQLVTDILDPTGGSLLYATSSSQAGDLQGVLKKNGFECRKEILYQSDASKALSSTTIAAMKSGDIDAILLYSPKSAEVLIQLIRKSRLVRVCKNMTVVCLSQAVATKAELIPWKKLIVADSPTQEALLNSLANQFNFGISKNGDTLDKIEDAKIVENKTQKTAVEYLDNNSGSPFKTIFYTFLVTAILGGGATATSNIWLPKLKEALPFVNFEMGNDKKIRFLTGRLQKLESRSTDNIPRLDELEGERKRLQLLLDSTLTRISSLEKSIKAAEQLISAVDTGTGPAVAQKTLNNLADRLTRLETDRSAESAKNHEQIVQMAKQLAQLKKKVPPTYNRNLNTKTQNLLLAIGQLRLAIKSGKSFSNELSSLNAFGPVVKKIIKSKGVLNDHKGSGISTPIKLQKSFLNLAGKIVQKDRLPEGDDFIDRSIARLAQSLKWRRTDKLDGNSAEAIVARTEEALKKNNLQEAVKELNSLPQSLIPLVEPWLAKAQALLAANDLLVELQSNAISMLTANE